MKAEYIKSNGRSSMAFCWDESAHGAYELEMLRRNGMSRMLAMEVRRIDDRILCCYEISGRQPFSVLFDRKPIRLPDIRELFVQIQQARQQAAEYLLEEDGLLLEPDYLYGKPDARVWSFCYGGEKTDGKEQMQALLQFILDHLDFQDTESVGVAYGLYQECQRTDGEFEALLQYLQGTKSEAEGNGEDSPFPERQQKEENKTGHPDGREDPEAAEPGMETAAGQETGLFAWLRGHLFGRKRGMQERLQLAQDSWQEEPEPEETPVKEHFETRNLAEENLEKRYVLKPLSAAETEAVGEEQLELTIFPFVIGTERGSVDGCLDSPYVSRFHARVTMEEGELYVEDLHSRNGTFVNRTEIMGTNRQKLQAGDEISFADRMFCLEIRYVC